MTHMGLEVTRSRDNWNYSRSLLFGWAIPFWHTGLAVSYPVLKDKVTVSGYLYNKTTGAYQNNRSKTLGAQVSAAPMENMVLIYNFLSGNEKDTNAIDHVRTLHELNGTYAISRKVSFAFDVVKGSLTNSGPGIGTADWLAWSVATKWAPGKLWLSPRFEVYEDHDGVSFGTTNGQRLTSQNLTLGYDMGSGLETRLEYREDKSSRAVFSKGNNGVSTDKQATGTLGILYNF